MFTDDKDRWDYQPTFEDLFGTHEFGTQADLDSVEVQCAARSLLESRGYFPMNEEVLHFLYTGLDSDLWVSVKRNEYTPDKAFALQAQREAVAMGLQALYGEIR